MRPSWVQICYIASCPGYSTFVDKHCTIRSQCCTFTKHNTSSSVKLIQMLVQRILKIFPLRVFCKETEWENCYIKGRQSSRSLKRSQVCKSIFYWFTLKQLHDSCLVWASSNLLSLSATLALKIDDLYKSFTM